MFSKIVPKNNMKKIIKNIFKVILESIELRYKRTISHDIKIIEANFPKEHIFYFHNHQNKYDV